MSGAKSSQLHSWMKIAWIVCSTESFKHLKLSVLLYISYYTPKTQLHMHQHQMFEN